MSRVRTTAATSSSSSESSQKPRISRCSTLTSLAWSVGFWAASKAPSVITGIIDREFPHMRGNIFTGCLKDISENAQNALQKMRAMTSNDQNGICTLWVATNPAFLITRPKDIEQIAALELRTIGKKGTLDSFGTIFGEKNIFYTSSTSKKPEEHKAWSEQRRLYNKALTQKGAIDELWEKIPEIVRRHMEELDGKNVELSHFFTDIAMDVIAGTQLGSNPLGDRLGTLHTTIDDTMSAILDTKTAVSLGVRNRFRLAPPKRLTEAKASLQKNISEHIIRHNYDHICTTRNLLRSLVAADQEKLSPELKESKEESKEESKQEAKGEVKLDLNTDKALAHGSFIFLAGHETTSKLMDFIARVLLQYPDVLAKLEAEFNLIDKDAPFSRETIERCIYLDYVVKEVLRLFPPISLTARSAEEDCKLTLRTGREVKIKKGSIILVSPWITHRDERNFENANEFNPERWRTMKEPKKGSYIPFFTGKRRCPGEPTAIIEAKVAIFMLVRQYKLHRLGEKMQDLLATKIKGTLHAAHPAPVRFGCK